MQFMLLDLFLVDRVDRDVCGSKCFLVETYDKYELSIVFFN